MIVVAGGTGLLGRDVVGRLVARGLPVRVVTRDLEHGHSALGPLAERVELVIGDVRDAGSLSAAVDGADTVVAAVQGFGGREAGGIEAVDRDGNRNLVAASARAGVRRFVLLSIHDASATDALALGRAKADVEAALRGDLDDADPDPADRLHGDVGRNRRRADPGVRPGPGLRPRSQPDQLRGRRGRRRHR